MVKFDHFSSALHAKHVEIFDRAVDLVHRANVATIIRSQLPENSEDLERYRAVTELMIFATSTAIAMRKLYDPLSYQLTQCAMLNRSFYETCLNSAYLAVGDEHRSRQTELYSIYRKFKSQTQFSERVGYRIRVSGPKISRKHPAVAEAINFFDSNKPYGTRPINAGRPEMITEIALYDRSAALYFSFSEDAVYDLASELIHGSNHGCRQFTGAITSNESEIIKNLEGISFEICISFIMSSLGVLRIFRKKLDLSEADKKLHEIFLELLDLNEIPVPEVLRT